MDMSTYQVRAMRTDQSPQVGENPREGREILVPLLGLAGEVGELLSEYKKYLRDGHSHELFNERIGEELGDLLWYVSNVASKFGLNLDDIAERNLAKCRDRWGESTGNQMALPFPRTAFDHDFPEQERLPRRIELEITDVSINGSQIVRVFIDGIQFGDDLTDNRHNDDGYRFHDVFHFAYAAVLGWSPVFRALLKRKRKSQPKIDEVEDGGRAIVIEEGIAAMVFSYAERHNFLDRAEAVSYELLRTIKSMTSHLEVGRSSAREWERAIMMGFKVWRQIKEKGRGRVIANLDKGLLSLKDPVG